MTYNCKQSHLGFRVTEEQKTCKTMCQKRGISAIFSCWCCCRQENTGICSKSRPPNKHRLSEFYTNDAYTLVRNHPLFLASLQKAHPSLTEHPYNLSLRRQKLHSFGINLMVVSFILYSIYLGLLTTLIVMGKHPQYFYDRANATMTLDLAKCKDVIKFFLNNFDRTDEAFVTRKYTIIKIILYVIMSSLFAKNLIVILVSLTTVIRPGPSGLEILAVILSWFYVLDWGEWQDEILFRCPVQYQLGAFGILLSYINVLVYFRMLFILDLGIYVVMLQVITIKFFRFFPVMLIVISGFGFTYWMLLQNQSVYRTPIEAILRTSLMIFDLGYEDRLYKPDEGGIGYYRLVHVIFILTAITFCIFIINLLIGKTSFNNRLS